MCSVSDSTIQEAILAALASDQHKSAGLSQEAFLDGALKSEACKLHRLSSLRALLKNGHIAPIEPTANADPIADPNVRWKLADRPTESAEVVKRIGNYVYRPSDVIGRGRLGVVIRGYHERLRCDVAIKFLRREFTDHPQFCQKFEREGRILARLDHPHIVKVHDAGQDPDGTYYIVMEYLDGRTLVQLTKEHGRLAAPLVAQYMSEVADALRFARQRGILHRDVKPDNVIVTSSGAKLADFNLAGIDEDTVRESPSAFESVASEVGKSSPLVGTLPYMAPERVKSERGDERSDIYSLGATFYTVGAGGFVFENVSLGPESNMNWCWHAVNVEPKRLMERAPGFPEPLAAVIHRCLAKDPERRYQNYDQLLRDLAAIRGTTQPTAPAEQRPRAPRKGWLLAIATSLLALAVIGLLMAWPMSDGTQAIRQKPTSVSETPQIQQPIAPTPAPMSETATAPPLERSTSLRDQLREHVPNPGEIELLNEIAGLFAVYFHDLRARAYEPTLASLRELESRQTDYTKRFLDAALEVVALGRDTVAARHSQLVQGANVEIELTEGTRLSGTIEAREVSSVTLETGTGQSVIQLADLSLGDIVRDCNHLKPVIAVRALSGEGAETFANAIEALPKAEDLSLWLPFLLRLAVAQAEDSVRAGAFDRAGQIYRTLAARKQDALGILPHLQGQFDLVDRELHAIELLDRREWPEVLAGYENTHAHPKAARELFESFDLKDDLLASSRIYYDWALVPDEQDDQKRLEFLDIDRKTQALILRDWNVPRSLERRRDAATAPAGLVIDFRFRPAAEDAGSHFRVSLQGPGIESRILKCDERSLWICKERKSLPQRLDPAAWHTLALLPSGGRLFIYVDGMLVTHVAATEASISKRFSVGVTRAELMMRHMWVKSDSR